MAAASLVAAIDALCDFVAAHPGARPRDGEWGPREVLAHLVYHHEGYVAQLEARRAGRPFPLPSGLFADINAAAVESLSSVPLPELTARVRRATRRFCDLVTDPGMERYRIRIKEGSKEWPLDELVPRVDAHVRNHLKKMQRKRELEQ